MDYPRWRLIVKIKASKIHEKFSMVALSFAMIMAAWGISGCGAINEWQIESQAAKLVDYSYLQDGHFHIFLCGTGTPVPAPDRAQSCVLIAVKGHIMVVDAGDGAISRIRELNLPLSQISRVFITHFHSDHIADLGEIINNSWISGRNRPVEIYGPSGISQLVEGFQQVYAFDAGYRHAHHGDDAKIENRAVNVHPFQFEDAHEAVTIIKDGDLCVSTFLVDHAPAKPAVGYRFEYKGKILVISGDTIMHSNVERYSKNADILIHSVMHKKLNLQIAKTLQAMDSEILQRNGRMLEDTLEYHTDTSEVGKLAQRSGVKKLVLTHMVPPPRNFFIGSAFKRSVSEFYNGELILGKDLLHLEL